MGRRSKIAEADRCLRLAGSLEQEARTCAERIQALRQEAREKRGKADMLRKRAHTLTRDALRGPRAGA